MELLEEKISPSLKAAKREIERKLNKHSDGKIKLNIISDAQKLRNDIENSKNLPYKIGQTVTHIKFGVGRVVGINEKKIEVQFVDGKKSIALILASKFLK